MSRFDEWAAAMACLRLGILAGSISVIALGAAERAQASAFYLRSGQGAEGVALQFAGGASGGIGLASIGWNPATITMFPGRHSNINAALIYPKASYNLLQSSLPGALQTPVGELGGDIAFVPSSNSAWQITDRLWLGYTSGAPWGLRSKAENFNNAAQVYGRSSKVKSYNIAPTVGYKVTDWLSVGAALQLQYFKVELKQAFGVPAAAAVLPGAPSSTILADDFEPGYKVGANITPWAGGSIGLSYRSAMHHDLSGKLKLPAAVPPALVFGKNPIEATVHLPESVLFGVSQVLNPQWQVHAGVEWTNWSRLRRVPIFGRITGAQVSSLNFEYDDAWYVSAGAEYAFSPNLTLRAGVSYEDSAVSDRVRNVRIFDNDRVGVSAGLGYKWNEKLTLDLSYAHYFIKDARVDLSPGNPSFAGVVYVGEAKPSVDVAALGITYRWDTPSRAEPAPVIRKY